MSNASKILSAGLCVCAAALSGQADADTLAGLGCQPQSQDSFFSRSGSIGLFVPESSAVFCPIPRPAARTLDDLAVMVNIALANDDGSCTLALRSGLTGDVIDSAAPTNEAEMLIAGRHRLDWPEDPLELDTNRLRYYELSCRLPENSSIVSYFYQFNP